METLGDYFEEGLIGIPPRECAKGIKNMGETAKEPLRKQLRHKDVNRRRGAASVLGYIETDASAELLGETLGDQHAAVRFYAADALSRLGPYAEKKLPVLKNALSKEEDEVTKEKINYALKSIEPNPSEDFNG